MKSIWREMVMSVIMGILLPGILMSWPVKREAADETGPPKAVEESGENFHKSSLQMKLRRNDGTVEQMDMDAYLVGVLLGELPSDFKREAKKAQAVAARTYARKAWVTGGKHGDGSVCESSGCCQAYTAPEDYLARGGDQRAIDQAREAVEATSGLVLTYEGGLIEATYFSCSGGSTEDALAVWGTDFPYLRAVYSPGEEHAAHDSDTVYFTKSDFEKALGLSLGDDPESWFGNAEYTAGRGISTILIGGRSFGGTQLRSMLGLNSTVFTMEADSSGVTITTRGFGHRVGMSQYGADAMAAKGSTCEEILAHYYPGTTLELTNDRR